MSKLVLVKSEMFGDVQCDFYANDDVICMTSEQLGQALDYAEPRVSIGNLVNRNEYLKDSEFSSVINLMTDAGLRETRIFTEDGIYEVTMLAKTEKAKIFRAFVRKTLKGLRTGQMQIIQSTSPQFTLTQIRQQELLIKAKNAEARERNAKTRQATLLLKERDSKYGVLSAQAVELLTINALEIITGENTLPRPALPSKMYSAGDIAQETGCSRQMVGRVASQYRLRTDQYGMHVLDKAQHSDKQVPTFKYNEDGRQELLRLLKMKLSK